MIYGDRNWDIMSLEYPGKRAMDWEGHEGFFSTYGNALYCGLGDV